MHRTYSLKCVPQPEALLGDSQCLTVPGVRTFLMFPGVFAPWSLRGNALKRRLEDSKTRRRSDIPSGGIEEVEFRAASSKVNRRQGTSGYCRVPSWTSLFSCALKI